jgi:hypothetical protein
VRGQRRRRYQTDGDQTNGAPQSSKGRLRSVR